SLKKRSNKLTESNSGFAFGSPSAPPSWDREHSACSPPWFYVAWPRGHNLRQHRASVSEFEADRRTWRAICQHEGTLAHRCLCEVWPFRFDPGGNWIFPARV